jgi:hypothetical protein
VFRGVESVRDQVHSTMQGICQRTFAATLGLSYP